MTLRPVLPQQPRRRSARLPPWAAARYILPGPGGEKPRSPAFSAAAQQTNAPLAYGKSGGSAKRPSSRIQAVDYAPRRTAAEQIGQCGVLAMYLPCSAARCRGEVVASWQQRNAVPTWTALAPVPRQP